MAAVRVALLALSLTLVGLAAGAPMAAAQPEPCVVGASEPNCLVSVQQRVCVTEPCDELDLCVAYGRLCLA